MHNGAKLTGFYKLCQVLIVDGKPIQIAKVELADLLKAYAIAKEHNRIKLRKDGTLEIIHNTAVKALCCIRCGGLMYPSESAKGSACFGCSTLLDRRAGRAKAWDHPRVRR